MAEMGLWAPPWSRAWWQWVPGGSRPSVENSCRGGERGHDDSGLPRSQAKLSSQASGELSCHLGSVTEGPTLCKTHALPFWLQVPQHRAQTCVFLRVTLCHAPKEVTELGAHRDGDAHRALLTVLQLVTCLLARPQPSLSLTGPSATGQVNSCPKVSQSRPGHKSEHILSSHSLQLGEGQLLINITI